METASPNFLTEITETDWEKTPESVKKLIARLEQRIAALEEQVKRNSKNSSQPASQDSPHLVADRATAGVLGTFETRLHKNFGAHWSEQRGGKKLLNEHENLFKLWHRVRDGTLARTQFILEVEPIRQSIHQLLTETAEYDIADGEKTPLAKTVGTCRQLLKVETAFWLFVRVEGMEPTNNAAEQAIRPAVLWRKCIYGSQSAQGSLFVGRMLTVVTSLRRQRRSVLEYLVEACCAQRQGLPAPSLLPVKAPATSAVNVT
jgi:Transposase IS66 family/Family of unknown function (DUF6444)